MEYDFVPITGYNTLTGRLLHFSIFKQKYREILSTILENDFTVAALSPSINDLFELVSRELPLDPFINTNNEEIKNDEVFIFKFIQDRTAYLKKNLNKLQ